MAEIKAQAEEPQPTTAEEAQQFEDNSSSGVLEKAAATENTPLEKVADDKDSTGEKAAEDKKAAVEKAAENKKPKLDKVAVNYDEEMAAVDELSKTNNDLHTRVTMASIAVHKLRLELACSVHPMLDVERKKALQACQACTDMVDELDRRLDNDDDEDQEGAGEPGAGAEELEGANIATDVAVNDELGQGDELVNPGIPKKQENMEMEVAEELQGKEITGDGKSGSDDEKFDGNAQYDESDASEINDKAEEDANDGSREDNDSDGSSEPEYDEWGVQKVHHPEEAGKEGYEDQAMELEEEQVDENEEENEGNESQDVEHEVAEILAEMSDIVSGSPPRRNVVMVDDLPIFERASQPISIRHRLQLFKGQLGDSDTDEEDDDDDDDSGGDSGEEASDEADDEDDDRDQEVPTHKETDTATEAEEGSAEDDSRGAGEFQDIPL